MSDQQICQLLVTSTQSLPTAVCSEESSILTYLSIPYTATQSESVQPVSTLTAKVALVQLMYQASDIPTTTLSGSAVYTADDGGPSATAPSDNGLSPGASAGIGVGVGVAAIILSGIVACIWWKKRNRRLQRRDSKEGTQSMLTPTTPKPTTPTPTKPLPTKPLPTTPTPTWTSTPWTPTPTTPTPRMPTLTREHLPDYSTGSNGFPVEKYKLSELPSTQGEVRSSGDDGDGPYELSELMTPYELQ